jgi:hypothetical protein
MNSSSPRLYTRRALSLRHSDALSAVTQAFIVESFHSCYVAANTFRLEFGNRWIDSAKGDLYECASRQLNI